VRHAAVAAVLSLLASNGILIFCANLVTPTLCASILDPDSPPAPFPIICLKIHQVSLSVSPCHALCQGQAHLRRRRVQRRRGNDSTAHDFLLFIQPPSARMQKKFQRFLRLVFHLRQQPHQRMPNRLRGLLAGRLTETGQLASQVNATQSIVIATTCSEVPKPERRHETLCAYVVAQVCARARAASDFQSVWYLGGDTGVLWDNSFSLHLSPSLSLHLSPSLSITLSPSLSISLSLSLSLLHKDLIPTWAIANSVADAPCRRICMQDSSDVFVELNLPVAPTMQVAGTLAWARYKNSVSFYAAAPLETEVLGSPPVECVGHRAWATGLSVDPVSSHAAHIEC
jgi:hypothetical protein